MKRIITLILLCILFLILDNALLPFLSIRGIYPSLLFVFVICYSIINGMREAIWISVFAGLLQDLYFFHGYGIHAFANLLLCVAAAHVGKNIFTEKRLIPIFTSFVLSFAKGMIIFCILYVLNQYTHIETTLYRSVYNMVVALILYPFTYKLSQKAFMKQEWRF